MLRQASTATMVGRELELAAIGRAFQDCLAGRVRWVLVGGEAGLGKTRLITEFVSELTSTQVDGAATVAVGQCVDLGGMGSALIPVREILRELLRRFGPTAVTEAADRSRRVLARLLPELGDSTDVDPDGLRDGVALLLEALSAIRPLVVLVEDAHWADPATVDLLRGLAWTCQQGRITIVLTYRPDEIGPGRPLEPLLTDLARSRQPTEIELDPLSLAEVSTQASRLLGVDLDAPAVRRVYERSGGVPFFVEEVARWEGGRGLPETVRNLVLSHYQRLSPLTRQVLRLIATGGISVPHDVVAAAFEDDPAILDGAARQAIEAHVLLRDPQCYVFRHALLREAILEDSVPGERRRNHARYGSVLSEHPDGRWAEIAHHWLEAHNPPKAFAATIAAIGEARALGAVASAATLGEQAIQLWPDVTDAADIAGADRVDFLATIANDWHLAVNPGRALETIAAATREITPGDSERLVDLLQLKYVLQTEEFDPGARETLEQATRLIPPPVDDAGHVRRAKVVADLAFRAVIDCDHANARKLAAAAAEEALGASDPAAAARALAYLGLACALDGDIPGSEQAFARARDADPSDAGEQRLGWFEGTVLIALGDALGALHLAEQALASAKADGTIQYWGQALCANAAEANLNLANTDQAEAMIAKGFRLGGSNDNDVLLAGRLGLSLWRDDNAEADACLTSIRARLAMTYEFEPANRPFVARLSAQVALARGELDGAWAAVVHCLGERRRMPDAHLELAVVAAETLSKLRNAGRAPDPDPERELRSLLDAASIWPIADDWRALIDAELSGPLGTGTDVPSWTAAVAAADIGRLPADRRVYTRLRLAEAQIIEGNKDAAVRTLDAARELGERFDARRLLREISELSDHAGLVAPQHHRPAGAPEDLTARELQVLDLIAEGLSNKQIGQRLFIATKTVSVHVSAILRKLGVSGRTEAAVLARNTIFQQR